MSRITVDRVSKTFNEKKIFSDYSIIINDGDRVAFMGPSGCGKSSLLKMFMGIYTPDSGSISVDGKLYPVFQENRLCESFSALSNVRLVCDDSDKNAGKKAAEILTRLGLGSELDTPAATLSGGMQRRVAIARALACYTPGGILLLDEPFTGLDPDNRENVADVIKNTVKDGTIVMVTHEERDAALLDCNIQLLYN